MARDQGEGGRLNYDRLQEIGLGWLNLSLTEFETITLHQFNCKLKGWQEVEDKRSRERWEQVRLTVQGIWQTVQWKGNKTPSVVDAYPMPWDPKPEAPMHDPHADRVRRWKFLQRNSGIKFGAAIMADLEAHREELERELGSIPIRKFPNSQK